MYLKQLEGSHKQIADQTDSNHLYIAVITDSIRQVTAHPLIQVILEYEDIP